MGREGFRGFFMTRIRLLVCGAALAVALMPLAALAATKTTDHLQAELANGDAQFVLAQQDAQGLQAQADKPRGDDWQISVFALGPLRQELTLVAIAPERNGG